MQTDVTPTLTLPLLAAGQAQKHVTLNESLMTLDALVQLAVTSASLGQPPAAPFAGQRFIVAAGPSGPWTGMSGKVALWQDEGWLFLTPRAGWTAWVAELNSHQVFDGSEWRSLLADVESLPSLALGEASTAPGLPLAVGGERVLFTHSGDSHRLNINKNGEQDTASVVFQTGFTGKAEIGTTGNDNLTFKSGLDTGEWLNRLVVTRNAGDVGIGTDNPSRGMSGKVVHIHAPVAASDWAVIHCTTGGSAGPYDGVVLGNIGGAATLWNYGDNSVIIGTNGATRLAIISNGDCGIGVSSPTCRLHVDGAVRTGVSLVANLPDAAAVGAGALLFVGDAPGGSIHAFSDGSVWRRVDTRAQVS